MAGDNILGDRVWLDTNGNGIQDGTESGVPGVKVFLLDDAGAPVLGSGGLPITAVTDATGLYLFDGLEPGTYRVGIEVPAGYALTKPNVPSTPSDPLLTSEDVDSDFLVPGNPISESRAVAFGDSYLDIDAGLIKLSSLAGSVYKDTGNDGVRAPGEAGIPSVTVTLTGTDDLGNPVTATAITDGSGNYKFDGLRPGNYNVTEGAVPATFIDGKDTAGTTGGDATTVNDKISGIVLTPGVDSTGNNFGEITPASISGVVYEDKNNDGIKDPADPPIPGTLVTLTGQDDKGNTIALSVTTGPDGSYKFDGLRPGNYSVTESQPSPYLDGKDNPGNSGGTLTNDKVSNIPLTEGKVVNGVDFGEVLPAKLSGFVYVDAGDDGVKGAGETPIAGVVVTLNGTDDTGAITAVSVTTGADGSYSFTGLRPGSYTVTETQPTAYNDGKDTAGSPGGGTATNDVISNITLGSGGDSPNNNFGELPKVNSIAGTVFEDKNNDGIKDPADPPIPGAVVTLTGTDPSGNPLPAVSVTTGPDGSYKFDNVPPGNYTVTETQPSPYLDGKDNSGNSGGVLTNDKVSNISLPFGQSKAVSGVDFAEVLPAKLSGFVYEDAGDDGVKGAGETPIAGVVVTLSGTDDTGAITAVSVTTGADGSYSFTGLRPGSYTVTETQPTAFNDGKDTAGTPGDGVVTNDKISNITLNSGENSQNNNFGELPKVNSIAGTVFEDKNNDGIKDPADPGIPGAVVTLTGTDPSGNPLPAVSVTTGPDGSYKFENVPAGTYVVTETQPSPYLDGKDSGGNSGGVVTNDKVSTIVLPAGVSTPVTGVNFGEVLPAKLSGFVYVDAGDDGVKGAGETPIAGVVVTLSGTDDTGAITAVSVTTGADGSYSFTGLRPGSYTVTETQPTAYNDGKDTAGSPGGGTATNDVISNITLGSGGDSPNNNFGELPKVNSIAGTVFEDKNNDGIKDPADPPIPGAVVTLTGTDPSGNPLPAVSVTTGPDGSYKFENVPAGTYVVTETQPSPYLDGKDSGGNSGGVVTNDKVSTIVLPAGVSTPVTGVNFGEVLPAKLSGFVYVDAGDDGVKGAGETPIAGVVVTLSGTDDTGAITAVSVTTGADGSYSFDGLRPGSYTVTETQPAAYNDGKDTAGTPGDGVVTNDKISNITLNSGENSQNNNFGELPKVNSIAGTVFEDKNNDGIKDPADPPIPGAVVTLTGTDPSGNPLPAVSVTTGPDGSYKFDNVPPGNYTVTETQPSPYLDGKDNPGNSGGVLTNDKVSNISLPFGQSKAVSGVDFAEVLPAKLSGFVYVDAGDDGVKGAGETPIAGVVVTLSGTDDTGAITAVSVTTGADGSYSFDGLRPGSYTVTETQPAAYNDGKDTAGTPGDGVVTNDKISNITLNSGENSQNNNFGELPKVNSIAGTVFEDKNNDGIKDPADPPIPGAVVTLTGTDPSGNPLPAVSVTTGPDGSYKFDNVPPGNYTVTETQPSPYLDGKDNPGNSGGVLTNDKVSNISLPFGQSKAVSGVDFAEVLPAKLSGFVYEDAGDDGVKGAGETPIAGVVVTLSGTDDTGAITAVSVTTGADGSYSFDGLRPGSYTVTETQPAAYNDGKDTAGTPGDGVVTNDKISNITLNSGENSQNNNFGELPVAPPLGSIAGTVFEDTNNDGAQDTGELGIAGVLVTLNGVDEAGFPVLLSTTTDANGNYKFADLSAGSYSVSETQPTDYLDGIDSAGSLGGTVTNDNIGDIVLTVGANSVNNNFGELKPAVIKGFVYEDGGDDGVKAPGEAGIKDVTVSLSGVDDTGAPVFAEVTTGADGSYVFAGLRPGTYTVIETQPAGYNDGKDTAGSLGGDATTVNDVIDGITVASGDVSENNNFGELPVAPPLSSIAGTVFEDKNNDGLQDPGESGIPGATVTLNGVDEAGLPVTLSTTTDADGNYKFADLLPGTYSVTESQPANYLDGKDTAGSTGGTVTDDKIANIVLTVGVDSVSNNFAELKPAQIKGFVYNDVGNDGVKGAGEAGIPGATVTLTGTDDLGAIVSRTVTTGADGSYSFGDLRPGKYTVVETQPGAFLDGKDTAGTPGDGVVTNDRISDITLSQGEVSNDNNFGELKPAEIKGFVYNDVGNDGAKGAGEAGIGGVLVTLTGTDDLGAAVTRSVTTGADGSYSFGNLRQGKYTVTESQPTAFLDGKDTAGTPGDGVVTNDKISDITLSQGESSQNNNFGEVKPGRIAGFVYNDVNDDGIKGGTEAGIGGAVVTLTGTDDLGNAITMSMTTAADGSYQFQTLRPGSYTVTEAQPAGFNDGKDTAGTPGDGVVTNDKISNITLTNGEDSQGNNFGELKPVAPGSIGDRVWYDKNANGIQDTGELGVSGAKVTLTGAGADGTLGTADDTTATTTTNATGNYVFNNLTPGAYQVTVDKPTGFNTFTRQDQGANEEADSDVSVTTGKTGTINLASGQNITSVDAGVYKVGIDVEKYVSGTQCYTNNNVGGQGIDCKYWVSNCTTTSTKVWSGFSWKTVTTPVGWTGITNCKATDKFDTIFGTKCGGTKSMYDVLCSTATTGVDAMMRECATAYLNSCHNNVNYCYTKEQVCAITRTCVGTLSYDKCHNTFKRENDLGCDFKSTKATWATCVDTTLYDADAPPGLEVKTGSTVIFTYKVTNTGDTALKDVVLKDDRITDVTYVSGDTNNNKLLDLNETWTYTAKETAQTGTVKNIGTVTGVDAVGGVTQVTDSDPAYYTGYSSAPLKGCLGDRVWLDSNADGIQNNGEVGVSGVKVSLLGAGVDGKFGTFDDTTATTTTNAQGNYVFNNLSAGKYVVTVEGPAGTVFTKQDQGTNDAADSDVGTNGKTAEITLAAGETNLTVDAGLRKVGIDVEKYVSGVKCVTVNNCTGQGANVGWWKDKCVGGSTWSGITQCKGTDSFNKIFGVNCVGGDRSLYTILCTTATSGRDYEMRECVSAYLNSCHSNVNYAYTTDQVCGHVKSCVASNNFVSTCQRFKAENDLGCDFSKAKSSYSCTVDTCLYDADSPPGLQVQTGSTVTFTYVVKNTGTSALKDVSLVDDRIATVTYVSGDANNNKMLDVGESWTYTAKEVASAGTIKNTGTVKGTDALGSGLVVTDKDDAYYTGTGVSAAKGCIGDRVWLDANGNGIQDGGECGVAGVKVTLKGAGKDGTWGTADDISATTTTSSSGNYSFTQLDAGKYQIVVDKASGYVFSAKDQGTNDSADSDVDATTGATGDIILAAGECKVDVDAGLTKTGKAAVGDMVWHDYNKNGVQDSGEGAWCGVLVKLINATTNAVVASQTTDSTGHYLFTGLEAGSYKVQFDKSAVASGNAWVTKDVGGNTATADLKDSDVSVTDATKPQVATTSTFTLAAGQVDLSRDAGITPLVIDLDGNGVKTIARSASDATFDLFGNGKAVKSGWISSGDAFLAVDKDSNGKIDSISELFGGTKKGDAFAKLDTYDTNNDGVVDSKDADFAKLSVWRDLDGDHVTDAGELMSLAAAGIASLSLNHNNQWKLDAQGNVLGETSKVTLDSGKTVAMTDVYFNVARADADAAGVCAPTIGDLTGSHKTLPKLGSLLCSDNAVLDKALGCSAHASTSSTSTSSTACDDGESMRRLATLMKHQAETCVTA